MPDTTEDPAADYLQPWYRKGNPTFRISATEAWDRASTWRGTDGQVVVVPPTRREYTLSGRIIGPAHGYNVMGDLLVVDVAEVGFTKDGFPHPRLHVVPLDWVGQIRDWARDDEHRPGLAQDYLIPWVPPEIG